jgi:CRP/FNR family transcriptional regulator
MQIEKLFPEFEPGLIAEIRDHAEIVTFKEGQVLLRKGQYFKSTMLVVEGLVKIYREDEEGNEFFMYYLQPGEACALSMICAMRHETSGIMAIAVKDSILISVPLTLMDTWMGTYKSWANFVLGTYRARFEELLTTIDDVAFRNMDERLEFYLQRQSENLGNLLPLTHQQIADDLNSSREVISRLLKKMEQLGKCKLHRNSIEFLGVS